MLLGGGSLSVWWLILLPSLVCVSKRESVECFGQQGSTKAPQCKINLVYHIFIDIKNTHQWPSLLCASFEPPHGPWYHMWWTTLCDQTVGRCDILKSVNIHPGSDHRHQKRKLTPRAGSKLFTHFSTSLSAQSYRGDMTPHLFMRPKSYTKQKIKKTIVIWMTKHAMCAEHKGGSHLYDNLSCPVIINYFKLPDVAILLHTLQIFDDDLWGWSD